MEFQTSNGVSFGVNMARAKVPLESDGLCFFDKDGVIVKEKYRSDGTFGSPRILDDLEFYTDIADVFLRNSNNNIRNIVVTNQPDIQNNCLDIKIFELMNQIIFSNYNIDCIIWCPHSASQNCECRKPKTKMFEWAIKNFKPFNQNYRFYGDRESDGEAAKRIRAEFVHVLGNSKQCNSLEHLHIDTLADLL
jgi:D-glycero-D-manno-heptose 1,7-bisphosphate phosphatase